MDVSIRWQTEHKPIREFKIAGKRTVFYCSPDECRLRAADRSWIIHYRLWQDWWRLSGVDEECVRSALRHVRGVCSVVRKVYADGPGGLPPRRLADWRPAPSVDGRVAYVCASAHMCANVHTSASPVSLLGAGLAPRVVPSDWPFDPWEFEGRAPAEEVAATLDAEYTRRPGRRRRRKNGRDEKA